ncbi:MAG TPA: hypothetical protein VHB97_19375, partial [Polyangia bacterium]|nr:hypothetical protein [Polyangia bacterium]
MNRHTLLASLVALLVSGVASAAIPESIDLVTQEYSGSCGSPLPATPAESFFTVDALPIPSQLVGQDANDNPPSWSEIASPFDSSILHEGANEIDFGVSTINGQDYCTISRHQASLYDTLGSKRELFDVYRNGTSYKGSTTINLTLAQIDPTLAEDLANYRDRIAGFEGDLIDNASSSDQLAHELDRLSDLQSKLDAMLDKGFDALDPAALDALLQEYADVGPDVQSALDQLVGDLEKDVQQYRDEIARIVGAFRAQVNAVTDGIVTGPARGGGFDPGNPSNYGMTTDPSQAPDIPIPQIGTDPFDPSHDPYAAYAASIVAQLDATISGGVVQDRATFQSVVGAWRTNQSVVQKAL